MMILRAISGEKETALAALPPPLCTDAEDGVAKPFVNTADRSGE